MSLLDRKLEIFRMAGELLNFSEAAAALGMTQSNVTQQIARLEEDFGVRLFDRSEKHLTLTPGGETLLAECGTLFAASGEIRRRVRNAVSRVRHYRVGGTMTAGGYLLPEIAARYMTEHPRKRIGIHIANTREISGLLKTRSLDLAIVEGPFDSEYFFSEELCKDELLAAAAPGKLPERFSLREYIRSGGAFVLREEGSGTRFYFDRFLRTMNLPFPREDDVILANSFDALKHLVRGGYGITVISRLAVEDELARNDLALSSFEEGRIQRGIHFLWTAGCDQRFAQEFISFAKKTPRPDRDAAEQIHN